MAKRGEVEKFRLLDMGGVLLLVVVVATCWGTSFLMMPMAYADNDDDDNSIEATYFLSLENGINTTAIMTVTESPAGGSGTLIIRYSGQFPGTVDLIIGDDPPIELDFVFDTTQATWISTGEHKIKAKGLNYILEGENVGELSGTGVTNFVISFSEDFQTLEGRIEGEVFNFEFDPVRIPTNPLDPGDVEPDGIFGDVLTGVRVNPEDDDDWMVK